MTTRSSTDRTSSLRMTPEIQPAPPPRTAPRRENEGGEATFVSRVIRVLCVDDHAMLVEGLRVQLSFSSDFEVVGRLATAARLVDEVQRLSPNVVILDIEMPGPTPSKWPTASAAPTPRSASSSSAPTSAMATSPRRSPPA